MSVDLSLWAVGTENIVCLQPLHRDVSGQISLMSAKTAIDRTFQTGNVVFLSFVLFWYKTIKLVKKKVGEVKT